MYVEQGHPNNLSYMYRKLKSTAYYLCIFSPTFILFICMWVNTTITHTYTNLYTQIGREEKFCKIPKKKKNRKQPEDYKNNKNK